MCKKTHTLGLRLRSATYLSVIAGVKRRRTMTSRIFKTWEKELRRNYDPEFAAGVIAKTQSNYRELQGASGMLKNPALNKHLRMLIYPCLALYNSLSEAGIDKEQSIQLVEQLSIVVMRPYKKWFRRLGKLPFFFGLLKFLTPWGMRKNFPAEGWKTEWLEISTDIIAFNFHRCFYLETLQAHNAPELTQVFCRLDRYFYDDISPYLEFKRNNSLATTGKPCDFFFHRVRKSDDGLPSSEK
jgi:hypothetical protein